MRDHRNAKAMAKTLRETLALRGVEIPHGAALEIVARQFGLPSWNVLAARIEAAPGPAAPAPIAFGPAVPILRIFDVEKTREFYLGFLGFAVDWEHRYGDNFPLYCQVSRAGLGLHLSEHAGDASPGEHVRLHDRGPGSARRADRPGLSLHEAGTGDDRGPAGADGDRPVQQPHPLHGADGLTPGGPEK